MDLDDFESIFGADPDVAYPRGTYDTIRQHRAHLGGELFIDRLLKHIKLTSGK